jgi:GH24 family phage-related lysozyme (muramidase)
MTLYPRARKIIQRYEEFKPIAVQDPYADEGVYVIGYGLNFYPDGSRVMQGQRVTKTKANEYLRIQLDSIRHWLNEFRFEIDEYQEEALVSFIHSIGVESFEDSLMCNYLEEGRVIRAGEEFHNWIFNEDLMIIPTVLSRRREERNLFLKDVADWDDFSTHMLVECFETYTGSEAQNMAIHNLESELDPYILASFINNFRFVSNESGETSTSLGLVA